MKQTYLTNLILLIAVLLLLWFAQQSQQPSSAANVLTHTTASNINQINIHKPQHPDIHLERNKSGWQLTAPYQARASTTRVNLLLSLLSAQVHSQFPTKDSEMLQQFGLNEHSAKLMLNQDIFTFGDTESISGRRYLLHNKLISLIDDQVSPLLAVSAASFVDNHLFPAKSKISKITLPRSIDAATKDTPALTITNHNGQWLSDAHSAVSSDKLTSLIQSWQQAYAIEVTHMNDDAIKQLSGISIKVWLDNAAEPQILWLKKSTKMLTISEPVHHLQYHFLAELSQQLFIQADATNSP